LQDIGFYDLHDGGHGEIDDNVIWGDITPFAPFKGKSAGVHTVKLSPKEFLDYEIEKEKILKNLR